VTLDPHATPADRQQAIAQLVTDLNKDQQPILIGPWRSEVGFESLYWLPFVRAIARRVRGFHDRASVVTRGGLAPLYAGLATQGIDLYTLRSVTAVRRENLYDHKVHYHGQTIKQLHETDWDVAVSRDAADALKLALPFHLLHPRWMYWALAPFWNEDAGLKYLASLGDFAPLAKPELPKDCPLPPKYVAVKFYGRHTFPYPHPDIAQFIQQVVATIAVQVPVVLLTTDGDYDDHVEIPITGPNITRLPQVPPDQNLMLQASVMAHATACVGTYGGAAQLALRLGVPSASFYLDWKGTAHAHLSLSSWISKTTNVPCLVGSLADVSFWRQLTSVSLSLLPQAKEAEAEGVPA